MAKDTSASSSVLEWLAGGSEGVDRTAQVLDLIAAPVWVSDAKGTVVIANRCWRSLVASPQSSQAGYDLCTVLIPADRERLTTQLEQYRSQPQHFELEVSLVGNQKEADRHSEGQPICMTVEPVLSDDGEVNGWMGTCTEGRAKARLTRHLEVKQKFLEQL
ncbi:MAG: PAS domain-containing protein, partial [Cyanobacteria bacterium J06597_1]